MSLLEAHPSPRGHNALCSLKSLPWLHRVLFGIVIYNLHVTGMKGPMLFTKWKKGQVNRTTEEQQLLL